MELAYVKTCYLVFGKAVSPEDSWGFSPTDHVMIQQNRTVYPGRWTLFEVPTFIRWKVSRFPIKTRNKDRGYICGSTEKQMEKQKLGILL